jgi:hypothetical protein
MSWDNVTGDSKILPSGGGSANEIKLESGKPKRIRLLDPTKEPYSFLEHTVEVSRVENGQTITLFRTIRCPKTSKNPNAPCKICDGQQLKRRARNAGNVWDHDLGAVQKLCQGEDVWKPMATTRKLGVDIYGVDWVVLKEGSTRNDTKYSSTNMGPSPFQLPASAQLFDIEAEYAPHTEEEAKAIIESIGLKWEDVISPPSIDYSVFPTLDSALDHVMPNGKYKDQTFRSMWEADSSPKGMVNFLATKSDRISPEKAAAQIILVNLGGANIPGVPRFNGSAPAQQAPTQTQSVPAQQTPPPQNNAGTQPANPSDRQNKIKQINDLLQSKKKFIDGGFNLIMDTMKQVSGGKTNIVDFTDAELDKMLESCQKD